MWFHAWLRGQSKTEPGTNEIMVTSNDMDIAKEVTIKTQEKLKNRIVRKEEENETKCIQFLQHTIEERKQ